MSIASMVDAKLLRESLTTPPAQPVAPAEGGGPPLAPAPPAPVGVPSGIVNQLMKWVPTETITLYVAFLAVLGPLVPPEGGQICNLNFAGRWKAVWIFAGISALIAIGLTAAKAKRGGTNFSWPIFEMITAPIAFGAWALALPVDAIAANVRLQHCDRSFLGHGSNNRSSHNRQRSRQGSELHPNPNRIALRGVTPFLVLSKPRHG